MLSTILKPFLYIISFNFVHPPSEVSVTVITIFHVKSHVHIVQGWWPTQHLNPVVQSLAPALRGCHVLAPSHSWLISYNVGFRALFHDFIFKLKCLGCTCAKGVIWIQWHITGQRKKREGFFPRLCDFGWLWIIHPPSVLGYFFFQAIELIILADC